jgi:hypothetical protein
MVWRDVGVGIAVDSTELEALLRENLVQDVIWDLDFILTPTWILEYEFARVCQGLDVSQLGTGGCQAMP